jgi:hypothetical protein
MIIVLEHSHIGPHIVHNLVAQSSGREENKCMESGSTKLKNYPAEVKMGNDCEEREAEKLSYQKDR